MRQGQPQNRQRSRGRGNNNRNANNRNQLNRSMESNGPDVRIRGTAAHIAEKYSQLANDAQTAGDTVSAQSYWQFAEHYNRLVAAAQAAQQQAREEQQAAREARGEGRKDGNDGEGSNQDERGRGRGRGRNNRNAQADAAHQDEGAADQDSRPNESVNGEGPQPELVDTPAEVVLSERNGADGGNAEAAETAGEGSEDGEAKAETRKPRRARKPKEEVAATTSEDAGGLPSFVTGTD